MGFEKFSIIKGKRKAPGLFLKPFYNQTRLKYEIMFTAPGYPGHIDDFSYVNRLFGMTFVGLMNMNVAFFGWKSLGDTVEIYSCAYSAGKLKMNKMAILPTNHIFSFTIKSLSDCFTFSIFDKNDIVICFFKMTKHANYKLGFENSILITNPAGTASDVHVFMNRKH